jgi:hypothetical protein
MLGGFKSNGTILPKRMEDTIPSKRLSKHKTQLMIEAKLCLPSRLTKIYMATTASDGSDNNSPSLNCLPPYDR